MGQSIGSNELLQMLSPQPRSMLLATCDLVPLDGGTTLVRAGEDLRHVHFVESGFLSAVWTDDNGTGVEVGQIGREGLSGSWVALGRRASPFNVVVQASGVALRMSTEDFLEGLDAHPEVKDVVLSYCLSFTRMVAETCHSHTRLRVEQRLARWLLMARDRLDGDELSITHEVLAKLLGVRRPGVTVALHILEGKRIIKARRGTIRILDRGKLAAVARTIEASSRVEHVAQAL